jgi:hypothetical protein
MAGYRVVGGSGKTGYYFWRYPDILLGLERSAFHHQVISPDDGAAEFFCLRFLIRLEFFVKPRALKILTEFFFTICNSVDRGRAEDE